MPEDPPSAPPRFPQLRARPRVRGMPAHPPVSGSIFAVNLPYESRWTTAGVP